MLTKLNLQYVALPTNIIIFILLNLNWTAIEDDKIKHVNNYLTYLQLISVTNKKV